MKRIVLLLTVLLSMLVSSACAHNTNVDERLLHKAELAYFDDDDDSKAFEYITEFLDTYPNHVDGRYIRARIYYSNDKNDVAIRDIKVAIKKHNKNSRVYLSTLYDFLACIYDDIDQMDEAVKYQKMAVKAVRREQPEKLCSFMFDLGQYYYNKGQIDEADNVFQSILKEDDTYQPAMVGLARSCMRRQKYDKGLEWLELAKKYDNDYSQIYRFEMQILKAMGRGKEAIDSAIKYCLTDKDADIDVLTEYIGLGYSYGIAKLKNAFRGTSDMRLPHIMARLHQDHGKYDEAIDCLKIIEYKNGASAPICSEMCLCYYNMGDFPKALAEINKAMELSDTISYISVRADLYRGWGKYNEAIADYMAAMQEHPAEGYYYYGLGWCYELMGNETEALKYYDEGVKVDSSHAYLALCRGDLLEKMGKITQAEADYRRVLVLDNEPETGSCRQYALHALGRDQDAIEWMDKIIENAPNYAGNWYDKSCLLTRMGRMDDALDALETALEKGFRRLAHMEHDDDMDPLRNLPRYKALIKLYKGRP